MGPGPQQPERRVQESRQCLAVELGLHPKVPLQALLVSIMWPGRKGPLDCTVFPTADMELGNIQHWARDYPVHQSHQFSAGVTVNQKGSKRGALQQLSCRNPECQVGSSCFHQPSAMFSQVTFCPMGLPISGGVSPGPLPQPCSPGPQPSMSRNHPAHTPAPL